MHGPPRYMNPHWGVSNVIGPELQLGGRQRLYFVWRNGVQFATQADSPDAAARDTWFEHFAKRAIAGASTTREWVEFVQGLARRVYGVPPLPD